MKILPKVLLASLLGVVTSFAGGFGGPPPFSNGSPLQSGTDGTYQASISGTNLTGIIRFAYSNGSQTVVPSQNVWVAASDGVIYRGNVDTTMAESDITGVLDSVSVNLDVGSDGELALPAIFIIAGQRAAGDFEATIDFKNPYGEFNGTGQMQGALGDTLTFITVSQGGTNSGRVFVESTNIVIANSGTPLPTSSFRVRGVRTSTSAGGGGLSTNSSTN